jgi:transcriptional regulator with XRE-family HTH domain
MNTSQAQPASDPGSSDRALGRLLKEWRGRRGYSQLDLALAAHTTQRHVSFIESGRAAPSRDMILRLATTLDLPLRQQNALLLAAGYAPAWRSVICRRPASPLSTVRSTTCWRSTSLFRLLSSTVAGICCAPIAARRG